MSKLVKKSPVIFEYPDKTTTREKRNDLIIIDVLAEHIANICLINA